MQDAEAKCKMESYCGTKLFYKLTPILHNKYEWKTGFDFNLIKTRACSANLKQLWNLYEWVQKNCISALRC